MITAVASKRFIITRKCFCLSSIAVITGRAAPGVSARFFFPSFVLLLLVLFDETLEWIAIELSQYYSDSLFIEHHPGRSRKPASDHGCWKTQKTWRFPQTWRQTCYNAYMHTCWDNTEITILSIHQLTAYMPAFFFNSSVHPRTSPRYWCWLTMVELMLHHIYSRYFSDMQRERVCKQGAVCLGECLDTYSHIAFVLWTLMCPDNIYSCNTSSLHQGRSGTRFQPWSFMH